MNLKYCAGIVVLLVSACFPFSICSAEGKTRREVVRSDLGSCPKLWWDTGKEFRKPAGLAILGATLGTGIAAWRANGTITRELQRHESYRDFTAVGDFYGKAVDFGIAQFGTYLLGVAFKNDAVREFGILTTHAALLSGAFSTGLKAIVNSKRPDGSNDGRLGSSFPSGHSIGAATLAGAVQRRYGTSRALPFHAAALYTGFSRVADNAHRPYEVIAGLGLGYATGYAVASAWEKTKRDGVHFALLPWANRWDSAGLSLQVQFGDDD